MLGVATAAGSNRLLATLPSAESERLLGQCEWVDMVSGSALCETDQPYQHVHFPVSGSISLLGNIDGRPALELGLIGEEGMLGATLVLGLEAAPVRAVVNVGGRALRLQRSRFCALLSDSPALVSALQRYLYVSMEHLSQSIACARFHEIEPRLARCLLMTHDRVHGDSFHLTHQLLADMLGVQRSAITIAAGALQGRGLIRYSRGDISVLLRDGLEAAACECYQADVNDYDRVFGRPAA